MPKVPQPWLVQYLDGSGFIDPNQPLDPGFTQILQDTLGDAGGPADGFDQILAGLSSIVDSLGPVLDEQDAALDGVLTALAAADTTPADNSFNGFLGAFDAGNSILDATAALAPPQLLLLPLDLSGQANPTLPAGQKSVDFGSIPLGSAPVLYTLGTASQIGNQYTGLSNVNQPTLFGDIFTVLYDERDSASGNQFFTFTLKVTPARRGDFTSQMTYNDRGNNQYTILTLHVTVV